MPTVRLAFTPAAAHVRTARLVAVAVARRAGVSTELYDEIRLAIGEACSRAVALHRQHGLTDLVEVLLTDGAGFTIRVTDRAPIDAGPATPVTDDPVALMEEAAMGFPDPEVYPVDATAADVGVDEAEEAVAVGMRLALLANLVDEISVRPAAQGAGTEVVMSWPVQGRTNGGRP
ncbi:MAG TPA: ATP-binding protein [Rugosimonospora sp.]|nr:ATP-binding protein [Rugosimonospora sp.]